jgi:hypothetical protein
LNGNSFSDDDLDELNAGAGVRLEIGSGLAVTAAGRYIASSTAALGQTSYISPDFRIDIYPVSGLSLYFENHPEIQSNRMSELFGTNPYLVDLPSLQATLFPINAGGGVTVFLGPVKVAARAGYRESPNFLFYERESEGGIESGRFAAQYGDVRILHGGGDIAVVLPGGFHTVLGLTVREGELTETKSSIPFFAPITARAMVAYAFAQKRGLVELTGSFQNRRYVDQTELEEAEAYFDLDLDFSFNVRPSLGLLLRIENLVPDYLEEWSHYPEPPLTVSAGLRVLW